MKRKFLFNNPNRKIQRRHLRAQMTEAELKLWSKIRKKRLGYGFRRQYSIGPYIVDFYCPRKRLVIELDGKQHQDTQEYDEYRTEYFKSLNMKVVRFWNKEVLKDINKVVKKIKVSL